MSFGVFVSVMPTDPYLFCRGHAGTHHWPCLALRELHVQVQSKTYEKVKQASIRKLCWDGKWNTYPASSAISCSNDSTWFWNRWIGHIPFTVCDTHFQTTRNILYRAKLRTYLWCCQGGGAAHGVLHLCCLNIQSFKLVFEFVHESWDLKRSGTMFLGTLMTFLTSR